MDKKRVLLVDDDPDLVNILKARMEREGFEFMDAKDGGEMLKLVKMKRPDVILLDIMLPGMDGYTALRELKKEDEYKNIPVIILTAKKKQEVGDLFTLENISFFVEKPFDTKDLLKKIRSVA